MAERLRLGFGRSPMLFKRDTDPVLKNTVVMIPFLPEDFNHDDFRVDITPIGNVTILPIFPLDGSDLKDEDLNGAFYGGYLGLYTPQRTEGDQFLVEIIEGLKTSNPRHSRILMQFSEGEWKQSPFNLPITIQHDK